MKALIATHYGPPDEMSVVELPTPRPGPGQMLVRLSAASLNATDIRLVTGGFQDLFQIVFPYVPGNDFAGTVVEVSSGVSQYAVGDEVFGQAMPRQLAAIASPLRPSISTGALAEYAVFEADTALIAHRPPSVSPRQAAALGIAGMTARAVARIAELKEGETVLVIGATGGVGTALLPLLKAAGVTTIASAGSDEDAALMRRLGADDVVGFDARDYPTGVDVVFNLVLFADRIASAAGALRPDGRLITIIYPAPEAAELGREDIAVRFVMDMAGDLGGMRDVAQAAEAGLLVATIARTFDIDQAVEAAVAFAETRSPGKIVVTFDDNRPATV